MNMIGRKSQSGQHFAESRIFGWLMVDVDHKFPLKCGKTAVLTPPPNKVEHEGWTLYTGVDIIHRSSSQGVDIIHSQLVGLT